MSLISKRKYSFPADHKLVYITYTVHHIRMNEMDADS